MSAPFIIGIGGTTRPGSSSEQALQMALAHARKLGAETKLFGGAELQMPMYDPATANDSEAARVFIEACRRADGVIMASPCYHGAVSGLVKNAIDYVEEMRADERVYFDGGKVPETPEKKVLDALNLNVCCRTHFLTHVDLIDKI